MEIGSHTKPSPAQASAPSRAEQITAAAAAGTDVSPETAVQQAEAVRFEPRGTVGRRAALDEVIRGAMERHLTIDPETRAVVTESIDPDTGKVVRQIPDETLLKLRLYARELRDAENAESGDGQHRTAKLA